MGSGESLDSLAEGYYGAYQGFSVEDDWCGVGSGESGRKDIKEDIKALVEKMIGVVVFVDKIVDIQRSDAFNKFK